MNEQTLAALVAATGESDPEAAVTSLLAKHAKAEGDALAARETIERLSGEVSAANARAADAVSRIDAIERAAELSAAKAEGKWSASLDGFLATLSVEQVRSWRASAPRIVPDGEIRAPKGAAGVGSPVEGMPEKVARAIEKAESQGWDALSGGEKAVITRHDANLANSLRGRKALLITVRNPTRRGVIRAQ